MFDIKIGEKGKARPDRPSDKQTISFIEELTFKNISLPAISIFSKQSENQNITCFLLYFLFSLENRLICFKNIFLAKNTTNTK